MTTILQDVKARQPEWFSRKNRKLFGDVSYRVLYGKATGNRYLVRGTYMWSDMFGQPKQLCYRINQIKDDLEIGELINITFNSIYDAKRWLKDN